MRISLLLFMVFFLAACGAKDGAGTRQQNQDAELLGSNDEPGPTQNDDSFNDLPVSPSQPLEVPGQESNVPSEEFTAFFHRVFDGKSRNGLARALKEGIHPEYGTFLVFKPGATPVMARYTSADRLMDEKAVDVARFLEDMDCTPTLSGESPAPCSDEPGFEKLPCTYEKAVGTNDLGNIIRDLRDLALIDYTDEEVGQADAVGHLVSRVLTIPAKYLVLMFGQIEGKWYLLCINTAYYDCGA